MARKKKVETIPAVEVGADLIEKAVTQELSNKSEPTPDELDLQAALSITSKTQEELEEKYKDVNVTPSESITDVLEEKATNVPPEGENVSSEATDGLELIPNDVGLEVVIESQQEDIKISLKHTDLNPLVKDILHIASLGGEIPFGNYTNLRKFPYQAEMTLPYAAKEAWENRPEEENDLDKSYTVSLSYVDANIFANKLVELGKKGAKLYGGVLTTGLMQAKLKMYIPVAEEKPNLTVGLDKFRYNREELHMLDYVALKALGSWYGVKVGSKSGIIKAILDKQAEIKWE